MRGPVASVERAQHQLMRVRDQIERINEEIIELKEAKNDMESLLERIEIEILKREDIRVTIIEEEKNEL